MLPGEPAVGWMASGVILDPWVFIYSFTSKFSSVQFHSRDGATIRTHVVFGLIARNVFLFKPGERPTMRKKLFTGEGRPSGQVWMDTFCQSENLKEAYRVESIKLSQCRTKAL